MITKTCIKCYQTKDITEYPKRSTSKDGHRNECKQCIKEYKSKYFKTYIKSISSELKQNRIDATKRWRKRNGDSIRDYKNNRYNNDINYRIIDNLRSRLTHALDGTAKSKSTLKLIGCSVEELKVHLQQTALQNGYADFDINNYSGQDYHIDHIIPCASFDLSVPEQQQECFHYSNLQILTAQENLSKKDCLTFN